MKKGIKKAPHLRTSKRGRKFKAGRGVKKVRRASSKLLRQNIYGTINVEGPHKGKIVRIMAKDPLTYREYMDQKQPEIIVEKNLMKYTGNWGIPLSQENKFRIDRRLFEEPLYDLEQDLKKEDSFKKTLHSDFPVNPRETISHELYHLKNPNTFDVVVFGEKMFKSPPEPKSKELLRTPEDMATLRSMVDIRKFKKPNHKLKKDIQAGFEGKVLNETIDFKEDK